MPTKYSTMLIRSVAVFCGSKSGNNKSFETHAQTLGELIGSHQLQLIYGGGNIGLMGTVANATLKNGGKVIGVMPKILDKQERSHQGLTELYITNDMHERKKKMYELCDAAVVLPGGVGTLDEFFEMITWNNLSIHDKYIFILNTDGFYNDLLAHIETMYVNGFLYEDPKERLRILNIPEELSLYL